MQTKTCPLTAERFKALAEQSQNEFRLLNIQHRTFGRLSALVLECGSNTNRGWWLHIYKMPNPVPEHGSTGKPFFVYLSAVSSVELGECVGSRIWHAIEFGSSSTGGVSATDVEREW